MTTPPPIQRIVVRLTNWVGDCVMNTPLLARLRELFPGAEVLVAGRKNVLGLFENHPHVDRLLALEDGSFSGFRAGAAAVREFRPDLGILLPNSLKSAAMFALAGVPRRVGYDRDARRIFLTDPVALRPEDLAVHETRYYLRLLHRWETARVAEPKLLLSVSDAERAAMAEWLAAEGIGPGDFVVGVNPAAFFGTAKRWPAERFATAAKHFAQSHGARVVVTGLPQERDVAQAVCDAGGAGFINGAGRMKLRELMAFLARADLFLTNDSGAMHIAAAFETPLVAIFGSTDWVTTAPLTSRGVIVRVDTPCAPCLLRHCPIDHRCMTGVTPAMVVDAAESLMRNRVDFRGAPR